jgi:hypothetical protein
MSSTEFLDMKSAVVWYTTETCGRRDIICATTQRPTGGQYSGLHTKNHPASMVRNEKQHETTIRFHTIKLVHRNYTTAEGKQHKGLSPSTATHAVEGCTCSNATSNPNYKYIYTFISLYCSHFFTFYYFIIILIMNFIRISVLTI